MQTLATKLPPKRKLPKPRGCFFVLFRILRLGTHLFSYYTYILGAFSVASCFPGRNGRPRRGAVQTTVQRVLRKMALKDRGGGRVAETRTQTEYWVEGDHTGRKLGSKGPRPVCLLCTGATLMG